MPCFHPLPAWRGKRVNAATGKRPIAFRMVDGFVDRPLELPCGRCPGCVQDRASEWALRCEHEAKSWANNWFLTLTYSPENLPPGGSLVLADLQKFWKRARLLWPDLRYFACGEYGERLERPHYHALVFNWLPGDLSRRTRMDGEILFDSPSVVNCWGLGHVRIDSFSPAAAQYVCNYVRKKVIVGADKHYGGRLPEFQVMSRRPGIGSFFVRDYMRDIYPDGFVTRRGGARRKAPRFYDLTLEKLNPKMMRRVKRARAAAAASNPDGSGSRLIVREAIEVGRRNFYDQVKGRPFEKGSL